MKIYCIDEPGLPNATSSILFYVNNISNKTLNYVGLSPWGDSIELARKLAIELNIPFYFLKMNRENFLAVMRTQGYEIK